MKVKPGGVVMIPKGAVHRLENLTKSQVEIIEVQMGDYLGEDDIVRLEDVYARPANEVRG
jgi:mannose-6-phosphate isomerase-like protein (cupin superfamily)